MRIDLVTRYLMTSLERINLARRHLQGNFEENEENPTEIISQGESINLQNLLEALQSEINLTKEALENQEREQ